MILNYDTLRLFVVGYVYLTKNNLYVFLIRERLREEGVCFNKELLK